MAVVLMVRVLSSALCGVETADGEKLNYADVADKVMEYWERIVDRIDAMSGAKDEPPQG